MKKEKPILFNAEMVRAVLIGNKTQTRRLLGGVRQTGLRINPLSPKHYENDVWIDAGADNTIHYQFKCPYGKVGDRLWVRENFYVLPFIWEKNHYKQPVHYAADSACAQIEDYIKKPSIHMPRWASRISLEIVDVRVERVQQITECNIYKEGLEEVPVRLEGEILYGFGVDEVNGIAEDNPLKAWKSLWDSINKKRGFGWDEDPWVWVVEFKLITT